MFRLRFDRREIPYWAARYEAEGDATIERDVAPPARARGYLTRSEFLTMCYWKSPRSQRQCEKNSEEFIWAATATALSTPCEQLRVGVLTLLAGVSWPSASAILHWTHREHYPILDVRALWSLGVDRPPSAYDFEYWWEYARCCRQLREECGATMRELDRALWQFAKEHANPR